MHTSEWQDKCSWNRFVVSHSSPASFLQSWEWGEFQKAIGNDVLRIGMYPGEFHAQSEQDPFAVTTIHRISLPLPTTHYWYVPRGPVTHSDQPHQQQEALRLIKRAVTDHNTSTPLFLRINPSWKKVDDSILWDGLGFSEPEIMSRKREPETTLITHADASDDELMERMHQKTRYNIRLAGRKGVTTECITGPQSRAILWDLLQETARREKIRQHDKTYYDTLCDMTQDVEGPQNNIDHEQLYSMILVAKFEDKPLATGLWLGFGDTLTYLYGGSSREHRNLMAPHKLHWDAIRWARDHGYVKYDWWGVEGKKSVFNLAGVSRFKQGFGGDTVEFADTHDIIFRPQTLKYLKALKKLREML